MRKNLEVYLTKAKKKNNPTLCELFLQSLEYFNKINRINWTRKKNNTVKPIGLNYYNKKTKTLPNKNQMLHK